MVVVSCGIISTMGHYFYTCVFNVNRYALAHVFPKPESSYVASKGIAQIFVVFSTGLELANSNLYRNVQGVQVKSFCVYLGFPIARLRLT